MEVNSTWLITSELANQRARKALFTCVAYTNFVYLSWNTLIFIGVCLKVEAWHCGNNMTSNREKEGKEICIRTTRDSSKLKFQNVWFSMISLLLDHPSEAQEDELLFEISMMKVLGAHQNIVSLVGCCTLQDHKFLVIEYIPFGDLLHWLRRKRRSVGSYVLLLLSRCLECRSTDQLTCRGRS